MYMYRSISTFSYYCLYNVVAGDYQWAMSGSIFLTFLVNSFMEMSQTDKSQLIPADILIPEMHYCFINPYWYGNHMWYSVSVTVLVWNLPDISDVWNSLSEQINFIFIWDEVVLSAFRKKKQSVLSCISLSLPPGRCKLSFLVLSLS